jgi:hypothetical protein
LNVANVNITTLSRLLTASSLVGVSYLNISRNSVAAPDEVVATLQQLPALRVLDCSWNVLSGPLPELPVNTMISWLDLAGNALSGSPPGSFSNLVNLVYFNVSHNRLQSTIPVQVLTSASIEYCIWPCARALIDMQTCQGESGHVKFCCFAGGVRVPESSTFVTIPSVAA